MVYFSITAPWRSRPEEPDRIAERIRSLLSALRSIAPEYKRWYSVVSDDNLPELDETETWLANVVAAKVLKGDLGEPIPYLGYMPNVTTVPSVFWDHPGQISIGVHAGSHMKNRVEVHSPNRHEMPSSVLTYPVVKQTVLALSHAFEPLWSDAGPATLRRSVVISRYKANPVLTPCWMIHLSPPLARQVAPPPGIIAERHEDGSLFLSVTDERFDPDNQAHVDGAHRLFAVLDKMQEKKPREEWRF